MSDWKKKMEALLSAGQKPTYDDLEEALAAALAEWKAVQVEAGELGDWLKRLTTAHLRKDASAVADILDIFIAMRVSVVPDAPASSKPLH